MFTGQALGLKDCHTERRRNSKVLHSLQRGYATSGCRKGLSFFAIRFHESW